jgi:hypothetical protein
MGLAASLGFSALGASEHAVNNRKRGKANRAEEKVRIRPFSRITTILTQTLSFSQLEIRPRAIMCVTGRLFS